jgi:hypothetical protein
MKTETILRGGVAMSLLTCTILMFFFAEGERKLDEFKVSKTKQIDSLKEENEFKDNQIGLRDMIIEEVKIQNPKMIDEILKNTEGFAYEK